VCARAAAAINAKTITNTLRCTQMPRAAQREQEEDSHGHDAIPDAQLLLDVVHDCKRRERRAAVLLPRAHTAAHAQPPKIKKIYTLLYCQSFITNE
jgi:hypothetical protein